MRPVEIVLLILAIVADTLAMSVMLPNNLIYLGNCFWLMISAKQESTNDKFICLFAMILDLMCAACLMVTQFLDYALKEFVPREGPLHSAVDKILKGIAWSFLAVSAYKICVALPLVNPYSEEELTNLFFWTFVFMANVEGADLSTTRQNSPRIPLRARPPNPNAALLTPPTNRGWDPIDAFLAILFIVSDVMSNYLVPSLTIFMWTFLLESVQWTENSFQELVTNLMVYVGLGISIYYSWKLILFILKEGFFRLAPPSGIHRSTIVQILCTLNGLWFGVTFYKMGLDFPMTSHSLDSEGVMTSLWYWGLTSMFLMLKDVTYDPPPPREPNRWDYLRI